MRSKLVYLVIEVKLYFNSFNNFFLYYNSEKDTKLKNPSLNGPQIFAFSNRSKYITELERFENKKYLDRFGKFSVNKN